MDLRETVRRIEVDIRTYASREASRRAYTRRMLAARRYALRDSARSVEEGEERQATEAVFALSSHPRGRRVDRARSPARRPRSVSFADDAGDALAEVWRYEAPDPRDVCVGSGYASRGEWPGASALLDPVFRPQRPGGDEKSSAYAISRRGLECYRIADDCCQGLAAGRALNGPIDSLFRQVSASVGNGGVGSLDALPASEFQVEARPRAAGYSAQTRLTWGAEPCRSSSITEPRAVPCRKSWLV